MKIYSYIKLASIATLSLACTTGQQIQPLTSSGSILVAKKVPAVTSVMPSHFLGFMPVNSKNYNLQFNSADNSLVMIDASGSKLTFKVLDSNIKQGNFKSMMQGTNPTWYASDAYFNNRGLPVPANGSKERFLKGVLGKSAIFFDQDLIIHSGKLHTSEVTGIRVSEDDLNQIANNLKSSLSLVSR